MKLALALVLLAAPATAQQWCGPRDQFLGGLARYGEVPVSVTAVPGGTMVEVFASTERGTWTVAITTADGPTCVAAYVALPASTLAPLTSPRPKPRPGEPA